MNMIATGRIGAATVGLLAAMAVASLGCGDSDDAPSPAETAPAADTTSARDSTTSRDTSEQGQRDKGGDAPEPAPSDDEPGSSGNDESEVADTVRGMYRALAAGDAAGVCSAMSAKAREAIASQPPGGSTAPPADRSCEGSLSKFLDAAAQSGVLERTLTAEVRGVEISGAKATATVSFGGPSGKVTLLREEGEWRFGAPPRAPGAR